MSIPAFPLQWPEGWPRSRSRKAGQFGKAAQVPGQSYRSKTDLTMAEAMKRLQYELDRLGVNEIWWKQVASEDRRGPYFSLSVDGHRLAYAILATRDERRRGKSEGVSPPTPPSALAA